MTSKQTKDLIGITLIVFCLLILVNAFTVASLHDYSGMFQGITNPAECFNPFVWLMR